MAYVSPTCPPLTNSLSLLHDGPSSDAPPPRLLNEDNDDDDDDNDDDGYDNDRWSSLSRLRIVVLDDDGDDDNDNNDNNDRWSLRSWSQRWLEEQSFRIARRRQVLRVRHLLVTAARRPVIRCSAAPALDRQQR